MPSERARVIGLLDELQAAERAGSHALGQWITTCRHPALRGGLRVMRARDASHAALAEGRLRALGGVPVARVTENLAALCGMLTAADLADRAKIAILLARFPGEVYDPFADVIRQIENDGETRALLETIGDDERASLAWLREVKDVDDTPPVETDGTATVEFLDALRAAETAGAEVFVAWIAVCTLGGLRGGLRTIAAREATQAALLAERLRELGGWPHATVPPPVRTVALSRFGARDVADESKLAAVLRRYPDDAAPVTSIRMAAEGADAETRALLRLIAAGEGATMAWLRAYHAAVVGRQTGWRGPDSA